MKKTIIIFFVFMLLGIASPSYAQDGVFSYGSMVGKQQLHAAVQPAFLSDADEFILFGRARYGLSANRDLSLKVGLLSDFVFLGAHFEQAHLRSTEKPLQTYFQYGAQFWNDFGLKGSYNVRYTFDDKLHVYTGLMYQPYFRNDVQHALLLPLGAAYFLEELGGHMFFEYNGSINDDASGLDAIHFGARFNLGSLNFN